MSKKYGIKIRGQYLRGDNALVTTKHCCKTFSNPESALQHVQENYPVCFSDSMFLIFQVEAK